MAYTKQILIPANTSKENAVSVEISMLPVVLKKIDITFPGGCAGLVGVKFDFEGSQYFPFVSQTWFIGNNQTITINPGFIFESKPNVLTVVGYNVDDRYQHTIYIVLDVTIRGSIFDPATNRSMIPNQPDFLSDRI